MTQRHLVLTSRELNSLTKEYRNQGYNIVTFGKDVRELEKGDSFVVIYKI